MGSENKTNEETSFQPSEPKLCPMGCGFFGSPSTLSLCSKCYRNLQLTDEERASAEGVRNLEFNAKCAFPSTCRFLDALPGLSAAPTHPFSFGSDGVGHDDKPKEKLPLRCKSCNKKVGLTGFKCRCGCTFCGVHRYPERHECSFDFKASGRDAIEKANPVVKADKLERL